MRDATYSLLPLPERDRLGEAPWWSTDDQALVWVDILGRKVRRTGLAGVDLQEWTTPAEVGFAMPGRDGEFLLGLRDGLHRLDPRTGALTLDSIVGSDSRAHRLNDGKTDRRGRVWFGTMHDAETAASASFYRFDTNGYSGAHRHHDLKRLGLEPRRYGHVPHGFHRAHDLGIPLRHGVRADVRRPRVRKGSRGVCSDELTVDTDGCVCGAKWNGHRIVRYRPDGVVDIELTLPVARPTSCMFVGSDLRTLAVTSARALRQSDLSADLDGSVFLIDVGAQGMPEEPNMIRAEQPAPAEWPHADRH